MYDFCVNRLSFRGWIRTMMLTCMNSLAVPVHLWMEHIMDPESGDLVTKRQGLLQPFLSTLTVVLILGLPVRGSHWVILLGIFLVWTGLTVGILDGILPWSDWIDLLNLGGSLFIVLSYSFLCGFRGVVVPVLVGTIGSIIPLNLVNLFRKGGHLHDFWSYNMAARVTCQILIGILQDITLKVLLDLSSLMSQPRGLDVQPSSRSPVIQTHYLHFVMLSPLYQFNLWKRFLQVGVPGISSVEVLFLQILYLLQDVASICSLCSGQTTVDVIGRSIVQVTGMVFQRSDRDDNNADKQSDIRSESVSTGEEGIISSWGSSESTTLYRTCVPSYRDLQTLEIMETRDQVCSWLVFDLLMITSTTSVFGIYFAVLAHDHSLGTHDSLSYQVTSVGTSNLVWKICIIVVGQLLLTNGMTLVLASSIQGNPDRLGSVSGDTLQSTWGKVFGDHTKIWSMVVLNFVFCVCIFVPDCLSQGFEP
mmetsp:Transcript_29225/g.45772  ORF Transcript_29225/g.45772 Transcript_29225/m.45772 type:complete len:476 (-) Transcript_29225:121-1548(-)